MMKSIMEFSRNWNYLDVKGNIQFILVAFYAMP